MSDATGFVAACFLLMVAVIVLLGAYRAERAEERTIAALEVIKQVAEQLLALKIVEADEEEDEEEK